LFCANDANSSAVDSRDTDSSDEDDEDEDEEEDDNEARSEVARDALVWDNKRAAVKLCEAWESSHDTT
jgi:hypothetical protein